jgi:hypothetical protein
MNPLNLVCTDTTRFIIPMLYTDSNYKSMLDKDFIDSYSFDYYEPNYDNKIIIVKRTNRIPKINYKLKYNYIRQNQYCFVYNIPDEFKEDYNYIMNGKFHLLSTKYYNRLIQFWNETNFLFTIKFNPVYELYRVSP